jgi:sugar/nucleoside kinase (ribokinase family)
MPNPEFRSEILRTARFFSQKGARVSFDPNVRPELMEPSRMKDLLDEVLGITSVLLPGEAKLDLLTGSKDQVSVKELFGRYDF